MFSSTVVRQCLIVDGVSMATVCTVPGDSSARQSLKLMEEGMKHMDEFQSFLRHPKLSAATLRHGTSNRPRRHRSEHRRSRSQPLSSPEAPRRPPRADDNQSCRSPVGHWPPSSPLGGRHRQAQGHHPTRRQSESRFRRSLSQDHLARSRCRSLSQGRHCRKQSRERYGQARGQTGKSLSYCGQTRHDENQIHYDTTRIRCPGGKHQSRGDNDRSHSKTRTSRNQKPPVSSQHKSWNSHEGHIESSRHYGNSAERYDQNASRYNERAQRYDQNASHYDESPDQYDRRDSHYGESPDLYEHRRASHFGESAQRYDEMASRHGDSQRHHSGYRGEARETERENRNQSAKHLPRQFTHSTPAAAPPSGPVGPRAGRAQQRRTIPNTFQRDDSPQGGHSEYRRQHTGRYSHLNISQNYNCEDSDCAPSHGGNGASRETTARGSSQRGAEPDPDESDELSNSLSKDSCTTGTNPPKERLQYRGRKRPSRPRNRRVASQWKSPCKTNSRPGLTYRPTHECQDSETSSGDSLEKEETISLAEKLFGLKLTSRKRWNRNHRKRLVVKKRPRGAEARPLMGGNSSCDSEDTTHEASKGTEPVDSGYDPSTSLPSETPRSAPYRLDRLSPMAAQPVEADKGEIPSAPQHQALGTVRDSGPWDREDLPPILPDSRCRETPRPVFRENSRDPFTDTAGNSFVKESRQRSQRRQTEIGTTPATTYSEKKLGLDLNATDLQALSHGDDKEFRMLATQRWCEQQNQPVDDPEWLSPLPSVSQMKTVGGDSSDSSTVPGADITDALHSPEIMGLHSHVSRREEPSNVFQELQTNFNNCCQSSSQGEFSDGNSSANHTLSTRVTDLPSLDETEVKECLEMGKTGSIVYFTDFEISSKSSGVMEYSPWLESTEDNSSRQFRGSDFDSSESFDDSAKERIKSPEQNEDSSFSRGRRGGPETDSNNTAQPQRPSDGDDDDKEFQTRAGLPQLTMDRTKKTETLASSEPREPPSKNELRRLQTERQPVKNYLFQDQDDVRTADATVRSVEKSVDTVADCLSPSVLPLCVFRDGR